MNYSIILNIFHIFIVSPLFLVVGYLKVNNPIYMYWILLVLGLIVLAYHSYKLSVRIMNNSSYWWINAIHILFVAPLMIYIGYNKTETLRFAYELMIMLGFASLGYHTFSIVRTLQTLDKI
jgi:hypothetical protein